MQSVLRAVAEVTLLALGALLVSAWALDAIGYLHEDDADEFAPSAYGRRLSEPY